MPGGGVNHALGPSRVSRENTTPGGSLADAEAGKQPIEHLLDTDAPGHLAESADGEAQILRHQFGREFGSMSHDAIEVVKTPFEGESLPLARHQSVAAAERRLGSALDLGEETVEPAAGPGRDRNRAVGRRGG